MIIYPIFIFWALFKLHNKVNLLLSNATKEYGLSA